MQSRSEDEMSCAERTDILQYLQYLVLIHPVRSWALTVLPPPAWLIACKVDGLLSLQSTAKRPQLLTGFIVSFYQSSTDISMDFFRRGARGRSKIFSG